MTLIAAHSRIALNPTGTSLCMDVLLLIVTELIVTVAFIIIPTVI
ncbi:hypothetical protein NITLEN_30017 [Nitrospira lenta]|uniref:Uncharacterized protein n=1 Tax=Nitrospira lenta TaxID=1436998 RepID=A0A330L7I3_9BACT|nr:hypothetical protein NITLEN_30017 [Nitrospira lenta]